MNLAPLPEEGAATAVSTVKDMWFLHIVIHEELMRMRPKPKRVDLA